MLTEDALIIVAALVAIGLAVLGTLDLLWPVKPRHPAESGAPTPRRWRSGHPRHAAGARQRYLKRRMSPEPPTPEGGAEPPRESTPETANVVEAVCAALEAATNTERREYEPLVTALVQRQEFAAARRLLEEALQDARVPAAHAETLRDLLAGTLSGELGQLTAHAIRSIQEAREAEALAALERAEQLLESVHDAALRLERREEVERRLWWSYNKLGLRRLEAGAFEEAIDPLLRALRLAGTASDRRADTRAVLIQAFESWTDACALGMREAADGGDQEAAIIWFNKLWTRLCAALEDGLSEDDLATPLVRARRLFDEISGERV